MVDGLAKFEARWKRIPKNARINVRAAMEKGAEEIVVDMNRRKPLAEIEIGWTWGKAPAGSFVIGKVGKTEYSTMRITIWARSAQGSGFDAKWFEFGTAPRAHKSGKSTGQIFAQPFFFPVWRARRKRVRSRISRALRKSIRES